MYNKKLSRISQVLEYYKIFGAKFTMQLLACTCVFRHVKVYVDTQTMPTLHDATPFHETLLQNAAAWRFVKVYMYIVYIGRWLLIQVCSIL